MGLEEMRATQARQTAERVGRDARVVSRQGSGATQHSLILAKAISDLAESVVGLAFAVEAMTPP